MTEHARALGWIGVLRAFLGIAWGVLLVFTASSLKESDYSPGIGRELILLDQWMFAAAGTASLLMASLRSVQGIALLGGRRWSRPFGMALSIFDIANLVFFPVSTALGLYGFVVYRHAGTVRGIGARPLTEPQRSPKMTDSK